MASDESSGAHASGFSVEEDPSGGFRWSAFGPNGTREGHAESRADAETAARSSEQELSRPTGAGA
ncbi:MAG: hypothetical protein WBP81_10200 [Solirubrobacteraceae bacterium]